MSKEFICKNCQQKASENFCSNCGQKTTVDKITFKETFQDFMEMVFSVNAPFLLTLKLLIVNPGKLFREYLSGKRKTYYKPVSFFIITTIIYLVIRSLIDYNPIANTVSNSTKNLNGTLLLEAGKYMVKNISNIMFLLVFTVGVFYKLFFYKKYTFAEFIAIAFYLVGFYTLLGTVIMIFLKLFNSDSKLITILAFAIYLVYSFMSFFKSKSFLTIVKIIFAYIFSFIMYTVFGFGLSFLIVWIKSL